MKNKLLLILVLFVQYAFGQDSTHFLIRPKSLKVQLTGGVGIETSYINQKTIFSGCVDINLLFNRKFFLGAYLADGLNSTSKLYVNNGSNREEYIISQGGIQAGYIFKPKKAVHLVVSTKYGSLSASSINTATKVPLFQSSSYLLPQVDAQLNLTRYIRMNVGIGYRYINPNAELFQQNIAGKMVYKVGFSLGRFYK